MAPVAPVRKLRVAAYTIPTDFPEADGTIAWDSTTLILVSVDADDHTGIGYSYAHAATAVVVDQTLKPLVLGRNAFDIEGITAAGVRAIRNNGDCGIARMAVSAVDNALWDLKAKLLGIPLCSLLGAARDNMLIYGSGGFTSYSSKQLEAQLGGWSADGIRYVKMKIGAHPEVDVARVALARSAIDTETALFVDANGAYTAKQAREKAQAFVALGVTWFEEPVPSSDRKGLRDIREHAPAGMNIAAGEYGYTLSYFDDMLHSGAVDVLQADATRCGGISNFLKAGYLAEAYGIPFSSHCAPALHLHAALALPSFFIAEYFHDHVRIESLLFDGIVPPVGGRITPDLSRPGLGLEFKYQDAEQFKL